jgi:hypothetical protein
MNIPPQPFRSAYEWWEDYLARNKIGAVVSREIGDLIERIERSPETATKADFDAVFYAIYSGPAGEYWPLPVRPDWTELEEAEVE